MEADMARFQFFCTGLLLLTCAAAVAKPDRELPKAVISPENAERLVKIDELKRDVWRIVWMPRQRQVAFLSWQQPVEILEIDSFKQSRLIGEGHKPIQFAISNDGKNAAWSDNSTMVHVLDSKSGKTLTVDTMTSQASIAFSPDGETFATGGYGTHAKLWKTKTGELVHLLGPLPEDRLVKGGLTVVFSPDGKTLAVGNRNSVTRLFDVKTGNLLHKLANQMSHELKFSPDNRELAIVHVDGSIGIWDASNGNLLRSCNTKAEELYSLDWSPKGDMLATSGKKAKITLWDSRSLKMLKELDSPDWVIQVRFSPDGTRLVSSGGTILRSPERKVTIWGMTGPNK
jgi:WD40 repeat protein